MVELVRAVVVVVDVAAAELVEAELVEATVSVVVVDAVPEVVVEVVAMAPANMLISPWAGKLSPEKPDEVCSVVTVSNIRQSVVCNVTHLAVGQEQRHNPTGREGRKSRLDPS